MRRGSSGRPDSPIHDCQLPRKKSQKHHWIICAWTSCFWQRFWRSDGQIPSWSSCEASKVPSSFYNERSFFFFFLCFLSPSTPKSKIPAHVEQYIAERTKPTPLPEFPDDTLEGDEDEQADEIMRQVLDEINLEKTWNSISPFSINMEVCRSSMHFSYHFLLARANVVVSMLRTKEPTKNWVWKYNSKLGNSFGIEWVLECFPWLFKFL